MKIKFLILFILPVTLYAQGEMVPFDHVLSDHEIIELLNVNYSAELKIIQDTYNGGDQIGAMEELTYYFKERFSERYFFDWNNFETRFADYNNMYSKRKEFHTKEALKHLDLYPATTPWKIGFLNLKGETVTSYPYRHLTRQHKAENIALLYHYTGDKKYLDYIPEQARSLNKAFNNNQYETIDDGNGAYEVYRAGNRVYNWLQVHQILLASEEYSVDQQMEMIRTFLHTAAKLYHHNPKYKEGNHQTRGMSALAMLAFLFPEIKGADLWKERALAHLEEHLNKEIYPDGFQFERSVHYHISDIENYFYPYQLAKLNNIELNTIWEKSIKGLFDVILEIAMPNRKAPVLQDDTDAPWSEFNEIDHTMALGTVLFGKSEYAFFAAANVESKYYWFLKPEQLERLSTIKKKKPEIASCALPQTGYYIMRNGWGFDDLYMVVAAGITPDKPSHQHGDMLGIQAYAFGNMVLPNYQVRYYLNDLAEFKNSWVKNVALVDSIPQGRHWKGNKGGSGYGEYKLLPTPQVIAWKTSKDFDVFIGEHDGNQHLGVKTYRTVIFVKEGFWVIRDRFMADNGIHATQQVWQGHYDVEKEGTHIRSVFPNGGGLEIIQLDSSAQNISKASVRGKGRSVFEKEFENEASWSTLLYPFKGFEERLAVDDYEDFRTNQWTIVSSKNCPESLKTNARQIIYNDEDFLLLDVSEAFINGKSISLGSRTDVWLNIQADEIEITNCGIQVIEVDSGNIQPGETIKL